MAKEDKDTKNLGGEKQAPPQVPPQAPEQITLGAVEEKVELAAGPRTPVKIRALKTLNPPPVVGDFKWVNEFGTYEADTQYVVPTFVAQWLDAQKLAIML